MSVLVIDGGKRLSGSVSVHGAKNSVLPILAATILNKGRSVVKNCPSLKDVSSSINILRHLGCHVRREDDVVIVDSAPMNRFDIPDCLMREMRSSVVFLGAILGRCGEATMSYPGGCELGPRPIDLHLASLCELGAEILEERGNLICKAGKLTGREINLSIPSVGATENVMLAASAAEGETVISNAAREPEIVDLQNFLNAMGAKVSGAGSSSIAIEGVRALREAEHRIIPDRIVAATFLSAAAMAGGDVLVRDMIPTHISTVVATLVEAGCDVTVGADSVRIRRDRPLRAIRPIRTMAYPGFPTDAQAPVMAATTRAEGTTVFVENIFENRYRHVGELSRMGADIKVEGRVAVVCGVPKLYGAQLSSTDLRGGAAMIVAALGAEGVSLISGLSHIDRGYDGVEWRLTALGADIERK